MLIRRPTDRKPSLPSSSGSYSSSSRVPPSTAGTPPTPTPLTSCSAPSSSRCALASTPRRQPRGAPSEFAWAALCSAPSPVGSCCSQILTFSPLPTMLQLCSKIRRTAKRWMHEPSVDQVMASFALSSAGFPPYRESSLPSPAGMTRPPCAPSPTMTKFSKSATPSSRNFSATLAYFTGVLPPSGSTLTRLATNPFVQEPQCPFFSWITHQQK
jgi:hypothetical protein